MTNTRDKWIVRLLELGLIAATIAVVAGCSTLATVTAPATTASSADPVKQPAAETATASTAIAPTAAPDAPAWQANQPDDVRASTLNIFGEFDGEHRGAIKQIGESGFQQHTYVDEGYDTDIVIDPTGQYMVFASTRNNEHPDLFMQRVDGMSVTQLTNDPADDAFPAFSPDGKQIAFASTRSGTWQIYTMDADGRNVVQQTNGLTQAVHPSFSPDGHKLVYSGLGGRSAQWELWTVDLMTGEKREIGYGLFPSWSPDKSINRIAFQRPRQRGSRWFSLWTLDLVDGEARRVTEVASSTNAAVTSPTWSPDGKKIAFSTIVDPAHEANGQGRNQQDIWTVNIDGSGRKRITDGNGSNLTPFWSADSRIYFISDRGGQECVWSVKTEGGTVQTAAAKTGDGFAQPASNSATKDPFANTPKHEASAGIDTQEATK